MEQESITLKTTLKALPANLLLMFLNFFIWKKLTKRKYVEP